METLPSMEACRVCANFYVTTSEMDFLNLFEPSQSVVNEMAFIVDELRAWQLNISCNDGLPQRICGNCFTRFGTIYSFRQECLEAQTKLLQAFVEGDCVEEIVTAQESMMNGVLPTDDEIHNEVIAGLESIMDSSIESNVAPTVDSNNDFKYYQNQNVPLSEDQKFDLEVMKPTENHEVHAPVISTSSEQLNSNDFPKTANQNIRQEHIKYDLESMVGQDLEEVLQGNYIPKQIPSVGNGMKDEDEDYEGTDSSPEDDDYFQSESKLNPLACQYCFAVDKQPLIFATVEDLSQHFFDAHDPTFPYTCPHCPMKFNKPSSRFRHVKQEHVQYRRTCKYCGKPLDGLSQKEHLEICQYIGDWECDMCGLEFKQVTHFVFRAHVQREHQSQKRQFKCSICNRVFSQRAAFEDHKTLHEKNCLLYCNECKEAFSDTYELKKHKYKAHNGELPVNCDYCDKAFVTYAFLNRHLYHFHPDKVGNSSNSTISCDNCGMEFSSVHKLRNHQQRARDENGKCIVFSQRKISLSRMGVYPCPFCSKRFNVKAQLSRHINTHDITKRPYKCDKCHIMCRSPAELRQHQEAAHMRIKPFACEQCGKKFAHKKDLRDHMMHHEELNIPCPEAGCEYICKNDKVLNEHIRQRHRLVPCEYCNETFTRHRLTLHLRNAHKKEIEMDVENLASSKEKVVVEFVANRVPNDISLNTPAEQYPEVVATNNNHPEDYETEQVIENEIVVT